VALNDITIRTMLQPGDMGYITYRHGVLYSQEYSYGIAFESYVAKGFHEFYSQYNPDKDCVWIAEHEGKTVGFLLLMHRPDNAAQLRYFLVEPAYRSIGLGKELMELYMQFYKAKGYSSSYLWTTHELEGAAALYKRHGFRLTEEVDSTAFGKLLKEQRYDLIS